MSSALNLHPPQTYSRLFRPWDSNKINGTAVHNPSTSSHSAAAVNVANAPTIKLECCTPPTTHANTPSSSVKTEQNCTFYYNSNMDSDRECLSSSSSSSSSHSSKSSLEDTLNNLTFFARTAHSSAQIPHLHETLDNFQLQKSNAELFLTQARIFNNAEQLEPHNKKLFYAQAMPSAHNLAAALPSSNAYGLDPFALGFMEQEYTRVMAEEAHLKALNARKQRPKKFKCPHCDVAFSNNGQLKGHIRIHTGERPFKCDVESCGKTFTRNEELTRHKRIHTGLRPYPCSVCGKKFGRRDHLKKHMKTHMQQQPMGPAIYVPVYPYLYGY